jgi:twitching motility protein PilI
VAARTSLRDYQRDLSARLQGAGGAPVASKLGVQVCGERWLVDLRDAGEVIPVPPMTPVPLTRAWFRGVANIRGNLVSIVDFGAFLGLGTASPSEQSRLLLLNERFRLGCALLVDRSLGLRSDAQLAERARGGAQTPWLRAEYDDVLGDAWRELDLAQLAQDPAFLSVAA